MSLSLIGSPTRFGSSANSATLTGSSNSSVLTGDLLLVGIESRSSTNTQPVASGWTFAKYANTTGGTLCIAWRVATSDGVQSLSFTFKGSGADPEAVVSAITAGVCYVIRGAHATAPLAALATGSGTTSPITFPTVTTTEAAELVFRFLGGQQATGSVDQKSPTWDAAVGNIITAQGNSGSGTGFSYLTASVETGPTPAAAIGTRSLTLQNTPSTWSRASIGILLASGAPPSAPANTVLPAITDDSTPETAEIVTASTGTWDNSPTSYAYQWKRNGTNISSGTGYTSSAYTLQVADEAQSITVQVTATNAGGSTAATSAAITPTAAPPAVVPVNTVAPTITTDGTPEVGEVVTVNPGTWTGSPTYTYQWLRSGSAISGATSSSYTLARSTSARTRSPARSPPPTRAARPSSTPRRSRPC
jgi:hypothetical protein